MSQGVSHMYIVDQITHENAKQDMFFRSLSISGLVLFLVILQWNWARGELGPSSGDGSVPVPLEGASSRLLVCFKCD